MRQLSNSLAQYFNVPVPHVPTKAPKSPPKGAFVKVSPDHDLAERSDCSVRAVAIACDIPYLAAHGSLQQAGRKSRKGCTAQVVTRALGKLFIRCGFGTDRPTYAKWLREHPKGTYIVFVTGHFFAVKDGVHMDSHSSLYKPRARVHGYWEVAV